MTYNRIVFQGTIGTAETWSSGFAFAAATGPGSYNDYNDLLQWAIGIGTFLEADGPGPNIRILMSTSTAITKIRVEDLTSSGALQQAAEHDVVGVQGFDTARQPPQASLVFSLRTGRPGRSYRGRNYWPAQGAQIGGADLRLGTPSAEDVATDASTLLQSIQTEQPGSLGLVPVVWSNKLGTGLPVQQVSVGDVVDTQRRRRDKEPEHYSTAQFPPAA